MILKPDSHLQMGKLVEVVGKVTDLDGGQVCKRPVSPVLDEICGPRKLDCWTVFCWDRSLMIICSGTWHSGVGNDGLG